MYGGRPRPPKNATTELRDVLKAFKRQALHAAMLSLFHPITGEQMTWHAEIPQDMVALTNILRADSKLNETPDF